MDKMNFRHLKKFKSKALNTTTKQQQNITPVVEKISDKNLLHCPWVFGYYDERSSEGGWQTMMHDTVARIALLCIFMCLRQNYVSCNACQTWSSCLFKIEGELIPFYITKAHLFFQWRSFSVPLYFNFCWIRRVVELRERGGRQTMTIPPSLVLQNRPLWFHVCWFSVSTSQSGVNNKNIVVTQIKCYS